MKLLFVCTGNINRSCAAELIARAVGPPGLDVASAAANGTSGRSMSGRMVVALGAVGLRPGPHRSRPLTAAVVGMADVVVGFQPSHLRAVDALGPVAPCRSLVEWSRTPLRKVPDPAFEGNHDEVVQILLDAVPRMLDDLVAVR